MGGRGASKSGSASSASSASNAVSASVSEPWNPKTDPQVIALDENIADMRNLAKNAEEAGQKDTARKFWQDANDYIKERSDYIRQKKTEEGKKQIAREPNQYLNKHISDYHQGSVKWALDRAIEKGGDFRMTKDGTLMSNFRDIIESTGMRLVLYKGGIYDVGIDQRNQADIFASSARGYGGGMNELSIRKIRDFPKILDVVPKNEILNLD